MTFKPKEIEQDENRDERRMWHVEKGIPVIRTGISVIQIATVIWWASGIENRVSALEKNAQATAWQAEKIIRMDEKLNAMQATLNDVRNYIQSMGGEQRRR